MHRHGRRDRNGDKKKGNVKPAQFEDDVSTEQELRLIRHGRRNWQQEKQLLRHIDPRDLNEYLLDQE